MTQFSGPLSALRPSSFTQMFIPVFLSLLIPSTLLYLTRLYNEYNRLKTTEGLKQILGPVTLLPNRSQFASIFGYSSRFVLGQFQFWLRKHDFYKSGWDISAAVSLWPNVRTTLLIADPTIFKEVCANRSRFPKPTEQYEPLTFFGRNILVTEGDEWKMYRRISAPAFSERNNQLVWGESIRTLSELFEEVWENKSQIELEDFCPVAMELSLRIISSAGFGNPIPWTHIPSPSPPPGHQMTFEESFQIVSKYTFLKIAVPDWVPCIPGIPGMKQLREVRTGFSELKVYLQEMIDQRRLTTTTTRNSDDLFSNLLAANDMEGNEGKSMKLGDSELIGNVFMFLLAGHETTAHTLAFMLSLLSLHPEEQEKLYLQVQKVCPNRVPTYNDVNLLTRAGAILNETLRLYPSPLGIPKYAAEDTSFTLTNLIGDRITVPVYEGTQVVLHPAGVHYNPRYWSNPTTFNPARFLSNWPKEAFVPFSSGARSCIGKRFAEIEIIAIITFLVSKYRISFPESLVPSSSVLSSGSEKKKLLEAIYGITLTPERVPLVFTRRREE